MADVKQCWLLGFCSGGGGLHWFERFFKPQVFTMVVVVVRVVLSSDCLSIYLLFYRPLLLCCLRLLSCTPEYVAGIKGFRLCTSASDEDADDVPAGENIAGGVFHHARHATIVLRIANKQNCEPTRCAQTDSATT